jgi:superfamily II DNA or RNA helicase
MPNCFADLAKIAGIEARPYQDRVVTSTLDWFNKGVKSVMINSPTGSGKTVMGLATARVLQDQHNVGIGWVAMRRNLLSQASEANQMFGSDAQFISMFDSNPPTHDKAGRPIGLIVIDEAQHDAASSMSHLHNLLQPQFVLGLSATPFRTDKIKLCFEKIIRDIGIHQLIQQGYLSPYHQYIVPEWSPECVVEHYLKDPQKWGKSIFYWLNQGQAVECLHLLRAGGVRAELVIGSQTMQEREKHLDDFEAGKLDALVNMHVLTEGYDCPTLKTAWVRDSSKGPTIQMAGRAFRIHKTLPIKNIVQSKHTKHPMVKTATPCESFVWMDESWRSVKPSDKAENTANAALHTLAKIETKMPDFLTKAREKAAGRRNRRQGFTF